MKIDPEIERIRAVRHRISEECGHDPKRLVAYYREVSRQLRAVSRKSKYRLILMPTESFMFQRKI